jgi:hypothetical protein
MLAYFEGAVLSNDGIPNFTMLEMSESLADALIMLGKNRKLGNAIVQTLIYELQDRQND